MSQYTEILNTKFVINNFFRIIANVFSIFRASGKSCLPIMLKIESSSLCNLRCQMCPLKVGLSRETGTLKFNNFKKIFDEIKPAYLNLTGIGEPLMNKDIFKIISYAKNKNAIIKIDTNGTLLNKNNIKSLIQSSPSIISISVDGATKKTYEKIRTGARFSDICKNIKSLISYRNKIKSKTKIHIFFVLQKDNILGFIDFLKFGKSLNVDSVNGTIVTPMGKNLNKDSLNIDENILVKMKNELNYFKQNCKINLNIEGIENFLYGKIQKYSNAPCFWPWYQASITWDGYLTPCCVMCDNEIVFGNVFQNSFMNIWNNEGFQEFRKKLSKKRTGICSTCSVDETFIYNKLKPFYKIPLIKYLSERK